LFGSSISTENKADSASAGGGGLFGSNTSTDQSKPKGNSATEVGSTLATTEAGKNSSLLNNDGNSHIAEKVGGAHILTGLTIGNIISEWEKSLEGHIDNFGKAVEQVKRRDMLLLENQKRITKLAKEARVLKTVHTGLQRDLETVSASQLDLENSLKLLEQDLDQLESSHQYDIDRNADDARKEAYEKAENLTLKMDSMGEQMKQVVEKLNRTQESRTGDESPESVVMKILNKHFISLEWLQRSAKRLTTEISTTSRLVARSHSTTQANTAYLSHR